MKTVLMEAIADHEYGLVWRRVGDQYEAQEDMVLRLRAYKFAEPVEVPDKRKANEYKNRAMKAEK